MIERLPEGAEVVASGPLPTPPSSPGDAEASTSHAWTNEAANTDTMGDMSASEPSTSQAPSPAPTADQGPTRKRRQSCGAPGAARKPCRETGKKRLQAVEEDSPPP